MIRRILLLVLIPVLAMSTIGCDDLEDNSPAFQVMVNGELFKAKQMQITTEEDGGYMLTGIDEANMLEIYLKNTSEGSHSFGEESENIVKFHNATGTFTTAIKNGGGELMLTGNNVLGDVTGTFHFLAADTSGARVHGTNGHIYQLPFGSAEIDFSDKARLKVDEEEIEILTMRAAVEGASINIQILGSQDRRVSILVPHTIGEGVVTLPSDEGDFIYYADGEGFPIANGTLIIEVHENNLNFIKANFQVETEGLHEIVGSLQVTY